MRERFAVAVVVLPFLAGAASAPASPDEQVVLRFQDPAIVEASGLVADADTFVTTNDSGDTGQLFVVDADTGRTAGVTTWSQEPVDVEALAPAGPGRVWVGDIGDNLEQRESIRVVRVPVGQEDQEAAGSSYELVYPGGPRDAETLLSHPGTGRLFVVSKEIFGAAVFAAPRELDPDGPNRLRRVGPALTFATDGAFFPDGDHLVLRNYGEAVVYRFPALRPVAELRLPDQQQGEAIAVSGDNRVYVTSEGRHQPVLEVSLPDGVRDRVQPASETGSTSSPGGSATPGGSASPSEPGELLEEEPTASRDPWQWALGGLLFVVAVVVLLLAVRPNTKHPTR